MNNWTFITDHGTVLAHIARKKTVRALDIAIELGISERKVRRIIAELSHEGYLKIEKSGNINKYKLNLNKKLRRPEDKGTKVKELLSVLLT